MANGLKFREVPKPQKTSTSNLPLRLMFGDSEKMEIELQSEDAKKLVQELENTSKSAQKSRNRTKLGTGSGNKPPFRSKRKAGGDQGDEFDRLVRMLESIRSMLKPLVSAAAVPKELQSSISAAWPRANESLGIAIARLRNKKKRRRLKPMLRRVGFTGEMLDAKEKSLNFHREINEKVVLLYDNKESMLDKFVRWVKPGFKVMNSILRSLKDLPGVEIAKEFKEHLESAYEVVETGQPE